MVKSKESESKSESKGFLKAREFFLNLKGLRHMVHSWCQYWVMWDQIGRKIGKELKSTCYFMLSEWVFQLGEEGKGISLSSVKL